MITPDRMNVSHIQSWMDDNETFDLSTQEMEASGGISCSLDTLSLHREAVTDEEYDYEEDYTGGWLYVGH